MGRKFSKKKSSFPDLNKMWFRRVTLPLFLFMAAYRAGECVIHNLLERREEKKGEEQVPVPLEKIPVRPEPVLMEKVGKPAKELI